MTNPPPYGYAPVSPPPRPPLTRQQRRGALIAGAVSLFLLQLGFTAVMIPIVLVLALLLIFGTVNLLSRTTTGDMGWDRFWAGNHFDAAPWIPWLIAMVVVGILIMVLAVLVSGWILRAHGVNRPRAITWSSIGIGIVAQWVVGGVLGVITNLASVTSQNGVAIGGLFAVGASLVTTVAVGALTWWWMAHAFRAPVAAAAAPLGQSA